MHSETNKLAHTSSDYSLSRRKAQCDALLLALVGPNLLEKWWLSPNLAFNSHTPEEIFKQDPDVIYNYLMRMAEGEW